MGKIKKVLTLFLSLAIMGIIFSRVDFVLFKRYVKAIDIPLFILAILFFIPQLLISAYRWQQMVKEEAAIDLWEAIRLNLAANTLNMFLPSRAGDLAKAYFMQKEKKITAKQGINITIFEKYLDLISLAVVVLVSLIFSVRWDQGTFSGLAYAVVMIGTVPVLCFFKIDKFFIKRTPGQLIYLLLLSIFLWFLDLFQFVVIFRAIHSEVSLFHIFRLVPLAILIGVLPVTIAGIGTRDAALIYFFAPYEQTAKIVGVGIFASLRYLVPGILGLPFLQRYLLKEREHSV